MLPLVWPTCQWRVIFYEKKKEKGKKKERDYPIVFFANSYSLPYLNMRHRAM